MRAATVVQQLCMSCRTSFKFYSMFYFTCDRSLRQRYIWLTAATVWQTDIASIHRVWCGQERLPFAIRDRTTTVWNRRWSTTSRTTSRPAATVHASAADWLTTTPSARRNSQTSTFASPKASSKLISRRTPLNTIIAFSRFEFYSLSIISWNLRLNRAIKTVSCFLNPDRIPRRTNVVLALIVIIFSKIS